MDENEIVVTEVAPAVTEDSAPPAQPSGEEPAPAESPGDSAPPEPETPPAPAAKEPTAAERRIAQLVAKQRDAEREAAYWRGLAEGRKPEEAPTTPTSEAGPPRIESFPVYDDYLIARAKWEFHQEARREATTREAEVAKSKKAQVEQTFMLRMEDAAKTDPEILLVLQDRSLPINTTMADLIKESEVGPQVLRYLANNRHESARISQLSPYNAAKELGKLEARIMSAPKPEPAKKISQAPEPIKPVTTSGKIPTDLEQLPIEEFMKRRNSQQFGTRR